jgi:hypothetical protein
MAPAKKKIRAGRKTTKISHERGTMKLSWKIPGFAAFGVSIIPDSISGS